MCTFDVDFIKKILGVNPLSKRFCQKLICSSHLTSEHIWHCKEPFSNTDSLVQHSVWFVACSVSDKCHHQSAQYTATYLQVRFFFPYFFEKTFTERTNCATTKNTTHINVIGINVVRLPQSTKIHFECHPRMVNWNLKKRRTNVITTMTSCTSSSWSVRQIPEW